MFNNGCTPVADVFLYYCNNIFFILFFKFSIINAQPSFSTKQHFIHLLFFSIINAQSVADVFVSHQNNILFKFSITDAYLLCCRRLSFYRNNIFFHGLKQISIINAQPIASVILSHQNNILFKFSIFNLQHVEDVFLSHQNNTLFICYFFNTQRTACCRRFSFLPQQNFVQNSNNQITTCDRRFSFS